jgi:enoyl-CoA hydratase/carnithine racemase
MATSISHSVQDGVVWLRLDGADRLNAIGSKTYRQLAGAVREFEGQRSVAAVVIHGAGRAFSAGADIEEMRGFADASEFEAFLHGFTDALDVIANSRLPVVAAIHGAALGGGLELALACDMRVATPDTKLGLPEAKLGMLPGAGGTQRLPRLVPFGVATEMLMLGNAISGERAYQLGLVNKLCDAAGLMDTAAELAHELAAGSSQVPAAAKWLLHATAELSVADGIDQERSLVGQLFDSSDGREGFAAFIEKRSPNFWNG